MTAFSDVVFESRATCGLVAPKSAPRIPGPVDSSTVHYNGPEVKITPAHAHTMCRRFWAGIQHFHMKPVSEGGRGWHDIAYTCAACIHGVVMAGRGKGVRTAANGTQHGNDTSYAVYALVGGSETPSEQMLRAIRAAANALGQPRLKKHADHKATACAGPKLNPWVDAGGPVKDDKPKEYPTDLSALLEIKTILRIPVGQTMDPVDRYNIVEAVRRLKG